MRDHCRINTIADKVRSYNRIFTLLGFMQVLTPACRSASRARSLPNQHNRGQGPLLQQGFYTARFHAGADAVPATRNFAMTGRYVCRMIRMYG